MPEFCNECCGEIWTYEERDELWKRFESAHKVGASTYGRDWLKINEIAIGAANGLGINPSSRKISALLSEVCLNVLRDFQRR